MGKDFLGILPHGHVAVSDSQENVPGVQGSVQLIEAVNPGGVPFRYGQNHLVFQKVHTGVRQDEIKSSSGV